MIQRVVLLAAKYHAPSRVLNSRSGRCRSASPGHNGNLPHNPRPAEERRPRQPVGSPTSTSGTSYHIDDKQELHHLENFPSLIQHAADTFGDRLLAVLGDPVLSAEAQTQKRAIEILETDAQDLPLAQRAFAARLKTHPSSLHCSR